jgi:Patatin-like phospholipase
MNTHQPEQSSIITRLKTWLTNLFQFIDVHLLSIIASVVGWLLLFKVPQITNLWLQWPNSSLELLGYLIFVALLIILYPITLLWLWQRTLLSVFAGEFREKLVGFFNDSNLLKRTADIVLAPSRTSTRILLVIAKKFAPASSGMLGYTLILILAVCGVWLMYWTPLDLSGGYLMIGAYIRMCGLWTILLAVWLFFGKRFGVQVVLDDSITKTGMTDDLSARQQRVWRTAARVLSWLAITTTVGEMLWITADMKLPYASFRLYSVWAAFHIPATCVGLMILWDMAKILIGSSARNYLLVGIVVVVFFSSLPGNRIHDLPPQKASDLATRVKSDQAKLENDEAWLLSLEQRIDSCPNGPAVIVAASGGGSRAALFSALVLQHLANQPMTWSDPKNKTEAASEGPGSDADKTHSSWADNIVLVSSVSGGSLTTARLVANPQLGTSKVASLQYTSSDELWQRTKQKLEAWTKKPEDSVKSPKPPESTAESEEVIRLKKIHKVLAKSELDAADKPVAEAVADAFTSELADDMAADFMAPILRGVLTPFASRGDTLYQFWQSRFGWASIQQNNYLAGSRSESETKQDSSQPSRPLAVINTTDVETGRRVIVGFPPLQAGLLAGSQRFPDEIRQSVNTAGRSTTFDAVALADFGSEKATSLSLTRSVRLSSNFPWGFGVQQFNDSSIPALSLFDNAPSARGQGRRQSLALIDGGVVDNTGIDSVAAIFESLMLRAEADPFGTSARIIDKLRRRGVVFIEIDSGAKPTGNASDETILGEVLKPLTALNNAAYTNALRIGDDLINDLLLKFSASPLAANLSPLPFGRLGTVNPYFQGLNESQVRAALGIVFPGDADPERALQSLYHYRFSCNHSKETKADVMTAFALGPDDKAIVFAMFLLESQQWYEWVRLRESQYRSYRQFFPDTVTELKKLPKDKAQQLAFQLIDRTQIELQSLQARIDESKDSEGLSQFEKEKRLKRIVTMLISLRTLSEIDGAWDMKSELWQDLSRITKYLDSDKLAQRIPTAQAGTDSQQPSQATIVQLDTEQLNVLFNETNRTRQQSKWADNANPEIWKVPMQASIENPEAAISFNPPLLSEAIRQKSTETRKSEEQSKFFKTKK